MIKRLQKIAALALVGSAFLANTEASAQTFVEHFNYPVGTALTANNWTAHSGAGSNSISVVENSLSYNAYRGSGVANSVSLTTSGEDVSKVFNATGVTSGSVYAGVLVNVSAAQADGDYFFHLGPSTMGFAFAGRVWVKSAPNGGVQFSVSKGSTAPTTYTNEFALNTTHLLVVKYTFNSASTTDDVVELFVNPNLDNAEPTTPSVTAADAGANDYENLGTVALRQGSGTKAGTLKADGIVVGTSWSALNAAAITGIADATKGMFSIYPNPMQSQNVRLSLPGHIGSQKVSLTVWSVEGKELFKATGSQAQVQESLNSKMSSLSKGMFFVNVTAGKEVYQTKLLKN